MSQPDQSDHDSTSNPNGVLVPWRELAIGGVLIAVAATTALIIVANRQKAGELATIALSLAVLAFMAELIIGFAQVASTNRQLVDSRALNAATNEVLIKVQSTSDTTLELVKQRFFEVFANALEATKQRANETDSDDALDSVSDTEAKYREAFEESVDEAIEDAMTASGATPLRSYAAPLDTESKRLAQSYLSFPNEEAGRRAWEVGQRLDAADLAWLTDKGSHEAHNVRFRRPRARRSESGSPRAQKMLDLGLVEVSEPPEGGQESDGDHRWTSLTEEGRDVARLSLARGRPPAWLEALRSNE